MTDNILDQKNSVLDSNQGAVLGSSQGPILNIDSGEEKENNISSNLAEEPNLTIKENSNFSNFFLPKIGDVLDGTVLSLTRNCLILDLGYTLGIVRGVELWQGLNFYPNLKAGDKIRATILELENEKGQVELSLREGGAKEAWENLKKFQEKNEFISIRILEANKGGLISQFCGITGFLPASHLKPEHYPKVEGDKERILEFLRKFVGKSLKVKIIKMDEKEEKLIFSEREALEKEEKERGSKYKIGDIVRGKVKTLTEFAAFVRFGEDEEDSEEGMIHVSEISWESVGKPSDKLKEGQEIEAKIIGQEETKSLLSIKQLSSDPWLKKVEKFKIGQIVKGKIKEIKPFGVFINLGDDVDGFCPNSSLGEIALEKDKEEEFKILSIFSEEHRIELGIRKK